MSAPVRLEAEFFDDPAVDALATILGYADRDTASGKLARLYSWQTAKFTAERPTYAVPRSILIGIFGVGGPEAVVEAGLATLQGDGLYKIHGSDKPNGRTPGKTRVNWLWLDRQAQAERGRRRSDAAGDDARNRGRFTSAVPAADQPLTIRKHADDQPLTSSLVSDLRTPDPEDTHTACAREATTPADPPAKSPDAHAAIALELHDAWSAAGRALATELNSTAKVGGAAEDPRVMRQIREVLGAWAIAARAEDRELRDVAGERMAAVLAVRSAVSRRERHVRWWAAPTFWALDGIDKDLATDPAAAARPRAGPRDQPRPRAHGQFVATTVPNRPDGEIPL